MFQKLDPTIWIILNDYSYFYRCHWEIQGKLAGHTTFTFRFHIPPLSVWEFKSLLSPDSHEGMGVRMTVTGFDKLISPEPKFSRADQVPHLEDLF